MKFRVYYEDTDALGIVYHANYLKYCDRARTELFFKNNISLEADGGFLVIKSINANYIKPAYFGDMLEIDSQITSLKKASAFIRQTITTKKQKIFEMDICLVYVENNKPRAMPALYHDLFSKHTDIIT